MTWMPNPKITPVPRTNTTTSHPYLTYFITNVIPRVIPPNPRITILIPAVNTMSKKTFHCTTLLTTIPTTVTPTPRNPTIIPREPHHTPCPVTLPQTTPCTIPYLTPCTMPLTKIPVTITPTLNQLTIPPRKTLHHQVQIPDQDHHCHSRQYPFRRPICQ